MKASLGCLPAHRTGKWDSSRKCCGFIPQKKNPNNCLQLIFVPCSSGATTHGCPPVVSACQVTNLALGLPPKHPNTSPWPGTTRTNTAVSFPLHKSSSAFFLPPQKRSSVPFLKPALFIRNCLLDPVVWLPTCEFFPLSLAARGVKCQAVEDIFYSHSIWLPGWLLCQSCCWLWSYLCSCLVFKSMELLHPHMLFSFLTFQLLWTFFQKLKLPCVVSTWVQDERFPWNGFSPHVGKVLENSSKFIHSHIYDIAESFPMALWQMVFALKTTIFSVSSVLLCTGGCLLWKFTCLPPQIAFYLKHLERCFVGNVLIWFVLITRGYKSLGLSEREFKDRVFHKTLEHISDRRAA